MAADTLGMSFVDRTGRSRARIDLRAISARAGADDVEIMRGDLAAILHGATRDDVEYVFGDAVRSLMPDGDGVEVTFEHAPPSRFDLVVGADGTHSSIRRLAFGPAEDFLRYLGYYVAFANADPALAEARWTSMYNVPGRMVGTYRSGAHAGAKVNFAFRSRAPIAYDHRDLDAQKHILERAFSDLGGTVPALLAGALADPDLYFDALSQVRMPSWSTGRVVLVGDAAYCASPVAGAGAMLSLVGAYRLAGELSATSDHELAFKRYEEGHRPLIERTQANLFIGMVAPKTRLGILSRTAMARSPLLGALARLDGRFQPKLEELPIYPLSL
jgi:2-polyprenyl-6-methoxyphenol hydroxylase-like FAD-dependent oxidoreductase